VLAFAEAARPKDVHHVSTLAVGGINPGGAPGVFDETSLDVGQRFNNDYERTKYEAEKLVHAFRARGGAGFVYRLGNVTGDSRTGRFQRNAADNRVVQVLRALVSVGELPCEPVAGPVLDHADTVAAAILALSRHAGVTPGTYHLAGSTPVPFDHIVRALDELGHRLRPSGARDLRSLFARSGDPDVAVARFWAQRPARGVRLDNTATQRLLDTLGVRFTPPDHTWLKAYLRCLIRQGVIPLPSGRRLVARKEMSCV
jgi:thioester reductase-like protein